MQVHVQCSSKCFWYSNIVSVPSDLGEHDILTDDFKEISGPDSLSALHPPDIGREDLVKLRTHGTT